MGFNPVDYDGEYGTMDGKQTVPRAEITAVIRALMAVNHFGMGLTEVTIWSDSKIVVNGYNKGKSHTLQSRLVTDWAEVWEQAAAILNRGTRVLVKKVKAHY
eukprot:2517078-Karenia_brevis.AAC.1